MMQPGEASRTTTTTTLPQFPKSFWLESVDAIPQFPSLTADLKTEVVVIGAGITGITTAYLLAKRGVKVVVLQAGRILEGTTGHTTAKLTTQHGLIYHEFLSHFGEEKTRLYYEANHEALMFIRQTVEELGIECQFTEEDAYLYTSEDAYLDQMQNEYMAYAKLNITADYLLSNPLPFETKAAIRIKGQARFNPVPYLLRLIQEITQLGGQIYEGTTVVGATHEQPSIVKTKQGHQVTCSHVVTASHYPFNDIKGAFFTRLHAEKSYVIAARTKKPFPGGMYINAEQPTRSLRAVTIHGEPAVLIGGEGHKTGQALCTHQFYENLQKFGEETFGLTEILYRWSAQDVFTLDKMPYIGQQFSDAPHLLMATGYRKWGMTNSMVAAMLNMKIILGEKSPYEEVFTPHRFHADPSIKTFIQQNANVAQHLIAGKFNLQHKQLEELSPDEGAVVQVKGKRAGAYRDPNGELHVVDTTCTHLGCEVEWNDAERTWDCPCHGSRYTFQGEVIEGPAKKALTKLAAE
ncbi:FAD-dependent oxidoreductase [Paenibacillus roseipurpureus]|uniref:FAD-dependent oxidoreductase n=1 Tax=Paenibacillus roseopurpureus TaxID=2918901 RepID=A0AA96LS70_9BACL|nr:FAD-dependent oxidoreductase [Paenibacillus sp. MBLB1832]WNR43750.1 FAD-dependent oxidoreductase [Paenibacillus sp. MBLB1832]